MLLHLIRKELSNKVTTIPAEHNLSCCGHTNPWVRPRNPAHVMSSQVSWPTVQGFSQCHSASGCRLWMRTPGTLIMVDVKQSQSSVKGGQAHFVLVILLFIPRHHPSLSYLVPWRVTPTGGITQSLSCRLISTQWETLTGERSESKEERQVGVFHLPFSHFCNVSSGSGVALQYNFP